MKIFNKILIANRGEIAVRIIKTAKKLNIKTAIIYSAVDVDSLHVSMADEVYCIGKSDLAETYLNIEKIISIALRAKCDAIHPGYGFLAENSAFVDACEKNGITFIGPHTKAMHVMGNKIEARAFVEKLDIPLTKGITGDPEKLIAEATKITFPLLVKAASGGGGKGMRIVRSESELREAIIATSREAKSYFGDETVYVEQFVENPRHIEIQVIGDNFGNVIHLYERECSIQRRYQKIIEEAPSITLNAKVRHEMGECAVKIAKEIGYNSVGTIEFLVDKDLNFYFLEMNTRIQVEHPVTEETLKIDLIEEQIRVAANFKLRLIQSDVSQKGHAIECRIYAEDPANNFIPAPGKMILYREPELNNIRLDTGITAKTEIKSFFDPMICKLIVWDENREMARVKMIEALENYTIHGIKTNVGFLISLLEDKAYVENSISTKYCDENLDRLNRQVEERKLSTDRNIPVIAYLLHNLEWSQNAMNAKQANVWDYIGYWRQSITLQVMMEEINFVIGVQKVKANYKFKISGKEYFTELHAMDESKIICSIDGFYHTVYISENENCDATVSIRGNIFKLRRTDLISTVFSPSEEESGGKSNKITSPMPGKVIKINVQEGDVVLKGQTLLIIEAMKMENSIISFKDATIKKVNVKMGQMVDGNTELISFEEEI